MRNKCSDTSFRIVNFSRFFFITCTRNKTFSEEIEERRREIPVESPSFPPSCSENRLYTEQVTSFKEPRKLRWCVMRRAEWRSPLRLRTLNKTISIVFDDLQFFLFSDTIIYFGMDYLIGDSLCSTIVACGKWACWNSSLLSSVFLQLDTSLWPGRYTWRKNLSW